MRLRNSFWAMLGRNVDLTPVKVVESVRLAMLGAVEDHCGVQWDHLHDRITLANDLATLWYMRSDLVNAISSTKGEAIARDCVTKITPLFRGYQPGGR